VLAGTGGHNNTDTQRTLTCAPRHTDTHNAHLLAHHRQHQHAKRHQRTAKIQAHGRTKGSTSRLFSLSRASMRISRPVHNSCMAAAAVRGDSVAVVDASAMSTRDRRRRATSSRVALHRRASRLGILCGMGCGVQAQGMQGQPGRHGSETCTLVITAFHAVVLSSSSFSIFIWWSYKTRQNACARVRWAAYIALVQGAQHCAIARSCHMLHGTQGARVCRSRCA